ncbi:hypothetical protein BD410DRAFT_815816 [Rickenella mellea]|uniref:Copper transport protein n=1 Tax=Rickenella mellea TaxID=50990 RepID=A0A4Y7PXD3_9AGAM|nr:hypothetical protein BD410DRAFT_815816 [Rickenella mellea]
MSTSVINLLAALVISPLLAFAHDNGMDMSMDGPMSLAEGHMTPYLHFTPGDMLWFLGWVPQSAGAMVGTCIGLFLLAIMERWIAACRSVMEVHWRKRVQILIANKLNATSSSSSLFRNPEPFIPAYNITRGVLHAVQAALSFSFMLVVMTFQVSFIIAVCLGFGVGEALFGRYAAHAHL